MNLIVLHYMPRTTRGWIEGRCKFIRSTEDDDQCTLRRSIGTDVRVKSNYTYVITMQMHLQTPFKSSKHAAAERNRLLTHENIGKSINSHLCSMHGGNNSALINCLQKKNKWMSRTLSGQLVEITEITLLSRDWQRTVRNQDNKFALFGIWKRIFFKKSQ